MKSHIIQKLKPAFITVGCYLCGAIIHGYMSDIKTIRRALISVFYKDGLEAVVRRLHIQGVEIISTGGTLDYIRKQLGVPAVAVDDLTNFPEILGGRVKTLHPGVFGGILMRRPLEQDQKDMAAHNLRPIDLVIVDLYPFEETLASTTDSVTIIEKIDIGGVALIRAAAKNHADVLVCASRHQYPDLLKLLEDKRGETSLDDRRLFATQAFHTTAHYDTAIFNWFNLNGNMPALHISAEGGQVLRYGENPHQSAKFYGALDEIVQKLHGKELSYNNIVDVDAALRLISEFDATAEATCAIIKHTNACGVATAATIKQAWDKALESDPTSAFGGIIICNQTVGADVAASVDALFYEVLLAPAFTPEALDILTRKKTRILLTYDVKYLSHTLVKTSLNGYLVQDDDTTMKSIDAWQSVTEQIPTAAQQADMLFAMKVCKHLKSNAITLVKNGQLIGMGCGQTSRIDALNQAIAKAQHYKFDTQGAVLASDAFFPFNDCVEIAHQHGIGAIIQPGGSVRDKDSIDAANTYNIPMVLTGVRHFRH